MKLTGENRSTRGKTCPSATLSTTNHTWTDPGSNPDLRGGRPATNPVSFMYLPRVNTLTSPRSLYNNVSQPNVTSQQTGNTRF